MYRIAVGLRRDEEFISYTVRHKLFLKIQYQQFIRNSEHNGCGLYVTPPWSDQLNSKERELFTYDDSDLLPLDDKSKSANL